MNKQEAIEKIKNIDTLNIKDSIADKGVDMVIKNQVIDLISQIDEPQKVVIPKFVAEWIEETKNNCLLDVMSCSPKEIKRWLYEERNENEKTFVRAWLDGYEIETEISKQDAIKYLERKSFPGWDTCSDKSTVSLSDAKYLIDLIYSHGNCEVEEVE